MKTQKISLNELRKVIKEIIKEEVQTEGYKWRPSATQKKEFAQRMQNPVEKETYEKRKEDKIIKRRSTSKFDYDSAGGYYVPTKNQYDFAIKNIHLFKTSEEEDAANQVIAAYTNNEKVHHDCIHIVNEKIRNLNTF